MNLFPCHAELLNDALSNDLDLSCPAEAGRLRPTLCPVGGQDKHPRRRSPPGQLQRVVRRRFLRSDTPEAAANAHATGGNALGVIADPYTLAA
jgi:hypothetical protein